jgi:hypothetical protein
MSKTFEIKLRSCLGNDYKFIHGLAKQNMEPYVEKYWGKWNEKKFKSDFKKENIKIIKLCNKQRNKKIKQSSKN